MSNLIEKAKTKPTDSAIMSAYFNVYGHYVCDLMRASVLLACKSRWNAI